MSGALLASSAIKVVELVTLSGQIIDSTPAGEDAHAYLKIDNDGKAYQRLETGAYTQIDSATDWVRPANVAPGSYEVRFTGLTGDALAFSTVVEDTWHPLSSGDFILQQTDITTNPGGKASTFNVEIRRGSSGPALDSASYQLNADRED